MTSAKTFEYLTGYLSGAISPVLNKKMHGKYDKQAYKGKVAYYCLAKFAFVFAFLTNYIYVCSVIN